MARVSVIIPCYHAESFIARPVKSLLTQTFTDWEAILVSDDGKDYRSILDTLGIHDLRVRFVSTGSIGTRQANARNVGQDYASSSIIAYLDHDDEYMPTYLEHMIPLVREHGVAFCNQRYVAEETGNTIPFHNILSGHDGPYNLASFWKLMIPPTAISILHDRKKVPARWYKDTIIAEDVIFPISCYAHVASIYATSSPLYVYYRYLGSTSNSSELAERFLEQKNELLRLVEAGKLLSDTPTLREYATRYLEIARDAERLYAERVPNHPQTLYTDCVVETLRSMDLL
jgi:glycosyltransferase involved in cell wall biosynthesis